MMLRTCIAAFRWKPGLFLSVRAFALIQARSVGALFGLGKRDRATTGQAGVPLIACRHRQVRAIANTPA